ncbi:PREDICTED: vascular endothelial growth factor C isoform X3 [Rhagoletis zephyria]|uniref:vascular endothelial growth factor C isoform X3 n=1 Tax=Rhagoletis zephyria TaxID=28612 RepID=UPI0008113E4E|nr:PREDICTED: vascular endothelial growth factor C isoform X3 [Rhagoletis zephyria]
MEKTKMHIKHLCASSHSLQWLLLIAVTFSTLHNSIECVEIPTRFLYNKHSADAAAANTAQNVNANALARVRVRRDVESANEVELMNFYKELDNVTDVTEFIERFVEKDTIDPKLGLQGTFRRSVERANVQIPKAANCIPESTVVPLTPLEPSRDPKVVYFPKCTRVKRCGGCCGSQLMSCQPTETETINFEVTKIYHGDSTRIRGKEIVVVEQHTRCQCDCRIKAEVGRRDCNSYQIYRRDMCSCVCTNEDALQKCLSQEHKYWDETTCRCVCRDSQSCTTGTIFDESQCACIDINQIEYVA